jgi:hypothetical protein
MRRRRFKFRSRWVALAASAACAAGGRPAWGQACCAGTGAVTPGRLALHESALAGIQLKAGDVLSSFDASGRVAPSPAGASEIDLEQDMFGAVRVLNRGQIALLVPLVETGRTSGGLSEFGGGVGDINASVRYDFTLAGASRVLPGIAALAGLTIPTGTPPDAPNLGPLATGATGIGAFQGTAGLAIEQAFGPWLVNATAIVAQRTARTVGVPPNQVHERLGAQWTFLAAVVYALPSEVALAASASYLVEGDATIGGVETDGTSHRLPTFTLSGVVPLSDTWRIQGALFDNPPIMHFGLNQSAAAGLMATVVKSWT